MKQFSPSFSSISLFSLQEVEEGEEELLLLDLVVDDVLQVLGDFARLVRIDRLLDLDAQRHGAAAVLALPRPRGDVAEALRARADRGLGVEVLEELDQREHDEEVDDEADGDEGDKRVDKVA